MKRIALSPGLLQLYQEKKVTVAQLARLLKVRPQVMYKVLRRYGMAVHPQRGPRPFSIPEEFLVEYRQHRNASRLARAIGRSVAATLETLRRLGEVSKDRLIDGTRARNAAIYEDYQAGLSHGLLQERHGLTRQRIGQIVHREARQRGETLRARGTATQVLPMPRTPIPQSVIDLHLAGQPPHVSAAQVGLGVERLRIRLKELGLPIHTSLRHQRAFRKYEEAYERFLDGDTMAELAQEHGTTVGNINQWLIRYRKETGARGKRRVPAGQVQGGRLWV